MKKITSLIIISLFKLSLTWGQTQPDTIQHQLPQNILKNNLYDSVTINGAVAEMSATDDSLIITYTKQGKIIGRDFYKMLRRDIRGSYIVVPVKMGTASFTLVTPKGKRKFDLPLYGVFTFHFEKEDTKLMVLHDGRLWFSEKAALATYDGIRLRGEYFNSWYITQRFEKFTHYPDFNNADQATVEIILLDWLKRLAEHSAKKANTVNTDRFGADYARDNFTRSLINHHLSPLATGEDFLKKVRQYRYKLNPDNQLPQDQIDSLKKKHPINEIGTQEI